MVNPALPVEAVGFRPWGEHWLGVADHALVHEPGADAARSREVAGDRRAARLALVFPAGVFEFIGGRDPVLGDYQACSLFSPMFEFADQARRARHGRGGAGRAVRPAARARGDEPPAAPRRSRRRAAPDAPAPSASATSCSAPCREPTVGPEGELRVGLRVSDGRVAACRASARRGPTSRAGCCRAARAARSRAAVPRLFSICGASQAAACALGLRCGAGEAIDARRAGAAARRWRPRPSRMRLAHVLDWPGGSARCRRRGASPRRARSCRSMARAGRRRRSAASRWRRRRAGRRVARARTRWPRCDRWVDAGQTRQRRASAACATTMPRRAARRARRCRRCAARSRRHAAWIGRAGGARSMADPGFARHPTWDGAPAETGALARMQADPLIAALRAASARACWPASSARLRELRAAAAPGARACDVGARDPGAPARGVAWVENARGLLVHLVALGPGRVAQLPHRRAHRVELPPRRRAGAALLRAAPRPTVDALAAHGMRLVQSLDPCVACQRRGRPMHEMSLAEGVREIVDETARANGARGVARCGWRSASWPGRDRGAALLLRRRQRGTLADGARLEIVETARHGLVHACCERRRRSRGAATPCPHCGSHQLQVTGGDECGCMDMEVE